MSRTRWLLATLLALSSTALSIDNTTMTMTLSPPNTPSCGTQDTTSNEAITFSLTNTPTTPHCFNLNSTFTHPNTTVPNFTYTLTGTSSFDYSLNYSQISYSQPASTSTNLTLKTYNGLDCNQVAESDGLIEPWTEWTCSTPSSGDGECTTLPYSVRSFEIRPVGERERRSGMECVVAAAYGKESAASGRVKVAGWGVVGVAVGVVVVMCG
ncbi:hypothetical protein CLAFUW4_11051 [Fulvia fulva]|uniref:Uncharacterized protein n=1 Tax=Passalora fulva TaxID=5499 RepID=A0A9Q8PDJ0_PASFU|nr:uncharacterized protein CLAFUR5_10093 [Fulvia fulva]KAK4619622.1 hypothetical protein CLAFUR4_11056 [Fulvia fulva]KAK4621074.1 hypothetical protein CLAFUR0_11062 [Fulvia fulva]UJO20460.1 hypothetical protein CLAFUR5_10093 [Fulvia fulva]WPV16955.1 hypothetical protein CLAFUW4_11051 [Fulvia fulva]WPV32037.1 hypothetical protein CLAFUW7_11048 [Fulvia fulva]